MRNILLASTALVAFAGAAAADVAISGSAEMGVSTVSDNPLGYIAGVGGLPGDLTASVGETSTLFHQSVDVRFTLSGEADGGLAFGAQIDLDDLVDTGADPVDVRGNFADFVVFISGDFGTLSMGDTDGAFDYAMQEVNLGGGSIADNETAHAGFNGNAGLDGFYNGQVLRYEYAFGDFAVAMSAEINDGSDDPVLGIGATYNYAFGGGSVVFGAGYQMTNGSRNILSLSDTVGVDTGTFNVIAEDATIIGISAVVRLDSGLSAGINYSRLEFDNLNILEPNRTLLADQDIDAGSHEREHLGIGVAYTFDAFTVAANYGEYRASGAAGDLFDSSGFGLDATYDLGGGLRARFGYGYTDFDIGGTNNTYSLGLSMNF